MHGEKVNQNFSWVFFRETERSMKMWRAVALP